jgi:chromosomal replication initiation ATPase DnaA
MLRTIKKEVCKVFKVKEKHLLLSRRGVESISRQMARSLSRELSGLRVLEVCAHFGIRGRQTVGSHVSRLRQNFWHRIEYWRESIAQSRLPAVNRRFDPIEHCWRELAPLTD